MRPSRIISICGAVVVLAGAIQSASAGGGRGYFGRHGGYYGYRTAPSYPSYSNPYLNPYSYESQALPYWLKPGYRSGNGNNGYSVPAARYDRFGAIAYSKSTGALGYSYGHYSQNDAEQDALSRCDASDREVIGWVRNAYGALAVGDDSAACGWAWGTTRDDAERAALAECKKQTTNCYIKRWVFSGD